MSTKTLTQEELKNVIAYADSLQQYDRRRQDQKLLEGIVRRETEKEGIALSAVYEIGQELDIPREYMQRALEVLYLRREQKVKDLEDVQGCIDQTVVHHSIHKRYKHRCLDALQRAAPLQKFAVKEEHPDLGWGGLLPSALIFYQQQPKMKKFFKWTYQAGTLKIRLAKLEFDVQASDRYKLSADLHHPLFLRAAGTELTALENECRALYKVTIWSTVRSHYDPHE